MGEDEPVQVSELWSVDDEGNQTVEYSVVDEAEIPRNRAERRRSRTRCKANGCVREPVIAGGRCEIHGGLKATAKPLPRETRYVWPEPAALQQQQVAALFQQGLISWREFQQEVIPAAPDSGVSIPLARAYMYGPDAYGNLLREAPASLLPALTAEPQQKQPWIWGDV